jgi:UPF0755 protein
VRIRALALPAGAAVAVVAVALGALLYEVRRAPSERAGEAVRLEVSSGEPFVAVASRLASAGVVTSPRALRVYAAVFRLDRRVQAGTYEFTVGARGVDVLRRLVAGDILRVSVTIPEGFTMWEIAGAFRAAGIDSVATLAAILDEERRARRRVEAPTLEGYLFPDTYRVPFGSGALDVVDMMLARMDGVFTDSLFARAAELGLTPNQVLTLASIVEAEARVPGERPLVAAVYRNRLRLGMRLEADPTVAYAMGGYRGRLLYADLEVDSPYNTYRRGGLPPGPICSPGEASIRAALYPDADTSMLYFVARGDGSHIFTKTLSEHLAAVRRVRQSRE